MDQEDEYVQYNSVVVTSLPKIVSRKPKPNIATANSITTTTTTTETNTKSNDLNGDTSKIEIKKESNYTNNVSPNINSNNNKETVFIDDCENGNSIKVKEEPDTTLTTTTTTTSSTTSTSYTNNVIEIGDDTTTTTTATTIEQVKNEFINDAEALEQAMLLEQIKNDTVKWDPFNNTSTSELEEFLEKRIKESYKSIIPRDHQWKTVMEVIKDLTFPQHTSSFKQGKRYNYLIQHAAGSGKSITIASLVYNLYKLEINNKLKFDTIVIMNDRSQLDAQLGDVIVKFLEANGVKNYCRPKTSKQLQYEISHGRNRVVITTMQKFAQLLPSTNRNNNHDSTSDFSFKTNSVAIISDEAHRSHGKSTTERLHEFLVGNTQQTSQITYFSFTCTPTPQCLEMFGVSTPGRDKKPFYTYSMQDALDDKLVLDVIDNFTQFRIKEDQIYKEFNQDDYDWEGPYLDELYELENSNINKDYEDAKAIQEKSIYILNHFIECKKQYDTADFKSRGMIVCSGRKSLLIFKKAIDSLIEKLPTKDQFDTIAAFSPFMHEGKNMVESDAIINGKYASYGTDKHRGVVRALQDDKSSKIRLLIVADKLQTGFDEPSLCMMYVDKKITGANAVQTLSRLSRISKDKRKTSIVDFVNSEQEIKQIFSVYRYCTTARTLSSETTLVERFTAVANSIKEAYSRERNLTTFAKSIIYHQTHSKTQPPPILTLADGTQKILNYKEIENDINEFLEIYPMIESSIDVPLPMSKNSIETVKKTLDQLKKQIEMVNSSFQIIVRIDYLTDKESKSFLDLKQNNVDYNADFAVSLWADKKRSSDDLMTKTESKILKFKETIKASINVNGTGITNTTPSPTHTNNSMFGHYHSNNGLSTSNTSSHNLSPTKSETSSLDTSMTSKSFSFYGSSSPSSSGASSMFSKSPLSSNNNNKNTMSDTSSPTGRKPSVWSLAKKSNLKRTTPSFQPNPTVHKPAPTMEPVLKKQK